MITNNLCMPSSSSSASSSNKQKNNSRKQKSSYNEQQQSASVSSSETRGVGVGGEEESNILHIKSSLDKVNFFIKNFIRFFLKNCNFYSLIILSKRTFNSSTIRVHHRLYYPRQHFCLLEPTLISPLQLKVI